MQEFIFFNKVEAISLVWLIGSLVTDIIITCVLVWHLVRKVPDRSLDLLTFGPAL